MFLRMITNEYGTPISEHLCETCFTTFTLCPARPNDKGWKNCLGIECPSYDSKRDIDKYFEKDGTVEIKKGKSDIEIIPKEPILH